MQALALKDKEQEHAGLVESASEMKVQHSTAQHSTAQYSI